MRWAMRSMGDEQVYAEDLCRAAGVSERTLRNVFLSTSELRLTGT